MKCYALSMLLLGSLTSYGCPPSDRNLSQSAPSTIQKEVKMPESMESLVVGGGCFWCIEVIFEELVGVYSVESGYAGGKSSSVTYDEVCTGLTGHAEVIKIAFDPKIVSRKDLLQLFFVVHDPTTLNQQGPDHGSQYRSVVFYSSELERKLAKEVQSATERQKIWPRPLVTKLEPLKNYVRAEEYHQDYFAKYEKASGAEREKMNAGYCAAIINPKVKKFREKFASRLKKKGIG